MQRSEVRAQVNRALDAFAARGGVITQCPPAFATYSQANSTLRPFRRIA